MSSIGRRMSRPVRATAVAVVFSLCLVPALAAANSTKQTVKNGYYASLVVVKSTEVEFFVRQHEKVVKLAVGCTPVNPDWGNSTFGIYLDIPTLALKDGRFHYSGTAKVYGVYASAIVGQATVTINAHHVNGPVFHYKYEGNHLKETTAFKGVASSSACKSMPRNGAFTLFGPISGE